MLRWGRFAHLAVVGGAPGLLLVVGNTVAVKTRLFFIVGSPAPGQCGRAGSTGQKRSTWCVCVCVHMKYD